LHMYFHMVRFVSILQELHIAVVWLFQSCRVSHRVVHTRRWIPAIWVLGCALGVADIIDTQWRFQRTLGVCISDQRDELTVIVTAAVAVASLVTYGAMVLRAVCSAPGSVQRRLLCRATLYPVNFLLTYCLMLKVYTAPEKASLTLWGWATVLQMGNGFYNTVTYALNSRYARGLLQGTSPKDKEMRVGISYDVMFERSPDVVSVARIGRAAILQSEQETVTCELANRDSTRDVGGIRSDNATPRGSTRELLVPSQNSAKEHTTLLHMLEAAIMISEEPERVEDPSPKSLYLRQPSSGQYSSATLDGEGGGAVRVMPTVDE